MPSSFRRAIVFITSWTTFGARPWLGSSNSTSPGAPTSARAIATICISPPDRFSHSRCIRYSSALKISKHSLSRQARNVVFLRAIERLRATVSVGKMRRSSGTQPMPRARDLVRRRARDVARRRSGRCRAAPASGRGPSAAASSCRRRSGRAARPPRRGRPRARRRTAPACRRRRCRRWRAQSITCMPRALRGSSAAPMGSRAARPACRAAMTWPQWSTDTVSARPNRKRMSCSMIDDRQLPLQLADEVGEPLGRLRAEAGGRLVEEEQARLGGQRDRDLERAPLAVREVARRRVLLAGEADARQHAGRLAPARPSRRARSRQASKPRRRTRGSAISTLSSARVVVEQVHDLERARDALLRDAARRQAGDVLAGERARGRGRARGGR